MENVAITALEVDPMQLQVIGLALLSLAIVMLAYFNSRSTNNLVGVMQSQVKSNGDLTTATIKQTDALRREQDLREAQIAASATITTAVQTLDGRSDERSKALLERIDGITDLVGERVNHGADRVMEAMKPFADALREIKISLETAQKDSQEQQQKQAGILSAIETKVELVSEQFIDVIQILGEMSDEDTKPVDGGGASGAFVSAGAASGSANGTGAEPTGDGSGPIGG